jgi:hypothetical protein
MVVTATDPDLATGGTLTFNDVSPFEVTKTSQTTANYTFTPTNDDVGKHNITLTVSDGNSEDQITAFFNVENVNDPPKITKVNSVTPPTNKIVDLTSEAIEDNSNYSIVIKAQDIDLDVSSSETLTWRQANPSITSGVNINTDPTSKSTTIGVDGKTLGNGIFDLNITVTDREELSDYVVVKIKVALISENKRPELTNGKMAPSSGDTDTDFTFSVHYYDADGDAPDSIKVVIDGTSHNMVLKSGEIPTNGVYELTTKLSDGTHTYSFEANDGINPSSQSQAETTSAITPSGGTGNGEKDDDKEGETDWTIYIVLIVVVIIILIVLFLVVMRLKKSQKEPEPEARPEPEPEPDHGPEDKPYYGSSYDDYDKERYDKGYDEPKYQPDVEEDIYDDQYAKPGKGKLPTPVKYEPYEAPAKGKLPEPVEDFGVEEAPAEAGYPTMIRLEDRSLPCGICLGTIKTGLMAVKCTCGKVYHDSCALRVLECPRCDTKFEEDYLRDMIDREQPPEAEFEVDDAFAEEEPPMVEEEDEWEPEAGPVPEKDGEPVDWDEGEEGGPPAEAGQICPSCGAETESKKFCGECGEKLE